MLTHLDLFSGIGGFALACEWAGIKTIGFVEIDKYCQNVLRKHWPAVPIVEDIRDVGKIKEIIANTQCVIRSRQAEGEVNRQGYGRDGTRTSLLQTTEQGEWGQSHQPVTLITGGFPCQPFSVAGKRGGMEDDRYLWPEMLNVIKEIMPRWVLGENVAGIVRMELDTCLSDLERIGYTTQAFIIPACAVNAPHRRDRVWIVAYDEQSISWRRRFPRDIGDKGRRTAETESESLQPTDRQTHPSNSKSGSSVMADSTTGQSWQSPESKGREDTGRGSQEVAIANAQRERLERTDTEGYSGTTGQSSQHGQREWQADWWATEPSVCGVVNGLSDGLYKGRVATGIKNRVDRLKCLGNAIVPQVSYQIIKRIAQIEDTSRSCTG